MWNKVDMVGKVLVDNGFYKAVGYRYGFINGATAWVAVPMSIKQWNKVCLCLVARPHEFYSRINWKTRTITVRYIYGDDIYIVFKVHRHYIYVMSFSELYGLYPSLVDSK